MTTGFFEIGIYHGKTSVNVGTLWRSAYQLGASGIFTIGRRYNRQASDTMCVPRNIPYRNYESFDAFNNARPFGSLLVGVEMGGKLLEDFCHPLQAVYLLGAEDHGLPEDVQEHCNFIVSLSAVRQLSYNVAVAGSIVMYHRLMNKFKAVL